MRKLFLLIIGIIIVVASQAQLLKSTKPPKGMKLKQSYESLARQINGTNSLSVVDTLDQYFLRVGPGGFWLYFAAPFGFVFGSSYYYDGLIYHPAVDATGCHYDSIGNATVTDVLIWAGDKIIVGLPDTISVNVYDVNTDTLPTTLLGSTRISTDTLDTTGFFTSVHMLNTNITSSFLLTVEYPGMNDTISFVATDTTTHDGKGEKRARQRLLVDLGFGTGWKPIADIWSDMDCDVIIMPVVDVQVGVKEFKNELFTLKPVSPVPSTGLVNLEYTLANATTISYRIMDGRGRIIMKSNSELKQAASYKEMIDMSSYSAGNYYITFNAGTKTLTQKMLIVR